MAGGRAHRVVRASDGGTGAPVGTGPGVTATTTAAAVARRGGRTLADLFDPRSNSLTVLRLLLAATVAVTHTTELARGWQPQLGETLLGDLAVDGFFVVSGFLVTASFLRLASLRRYLWHRFLRIAPAFYVCLVLTAAVFAPLASVLNGGGALAVYRGDGSALDYVVDNAALLIRQFDIEALPAGTPGDGTANGALWTLFYEALCYGIVAALGVVGVLRRKPVLVLGLLGLLQVATIAEEFGVGFVPQELLLRLTFVFLLGAAAHLFSGHVVMTWPWTLAAAATLVGGLALFEDYRAVGALGFAYLVLLAVVKLPLRQDPGWDLSYGVYIYHWPVIVLLVSTPVADLPVAAVVVVVLATAAAVAAASWWLVEAPALRMKSAPRVTRPLPGALDRIGRVGAR